MTGDWIAACIDEIKEEHDVIVDRWLLEGAISRAMGEADSERRYLESRRKLDVKALVSFNKAIKITVNAWNNLPAFDRETVMQFGFSASSANHITEEMCARAKKKWLDNLDGIAQAAAELERLVKQNVGNPGSLREKQLGMSIIPLRAAYRIMDDWWFTSVNKKFDPCFEWNDKDHTDLALPVNTAAQLIVAVAIQINPRYTAVNCDSVSQWFRKNTG